VDFRTCGLLIFADRCCEFEMPIYGFGILLCSFFFRGATVGDLGEKGSEICDESHSRLVQISLFAEQVFSMVN